MTFSVFHTPFVNTRKITLLMTCNNWFYQSNTYTNLSWFDETLYIHLIRPAKYCFLSTCWFSRIRLLQYIDMCVFGSYLDNLTLTKYYSSISTFPQTVKIVHSINHNNSFKNVKTAIFILSYFLHWQLQWKIVSAFCLKSRQQIS